MLEPRKPVPPVTRTVSSSIFGKGSRVEPDMFEVVLEICRNLTFWSLLSSNAMLTVAVHGPG
jgi:hypothetical protein